MSSLKFNRLANLVVSSGASIPQKSALTATVNPPPKITFEKDFAMLARVPLRAVQQQSVRAVSGIPTPTTKKPTLEEFDPLNPGEWQLGAGGKILPRLPEGTRVGKLVMGKYGLYHPKQRRLAQEYAAGLDAGNKSEAATPVHARWTFIAKVLAHICFLIGCWNITVLTIGRPLWPYAGAKPPGST